MLTIRVKPNAKQNKVERLQDDVYLVTTTMAAKQGAANQKVIKLLAEFLDLPQSSLYIKRGLHSRIKVIDFIS